MEVVAVDGRLKKCILDLKRKKQALILAHNYQRAEIKEVSDFTGDSLELSRRAAEAGGSLIVFCGVRFMAETAKILNPEARVLLPRSDAGCPMADMVEPFHVASLRAQHPDAAICAYVNSSASVKACVDVCCTSSNALLVVKGLAQGKVIMLPDRNLASWVAKHTEKTIIPFEGHCYVHRKFRASDLVQARRAHPDALIIAHPECDPVVLDLADEVASTSGMLRIAHETGNRELVIATEWGIIEQLKAAFPDKPVYSAGAARTCFNMKKTTAEDVLLALEEDRYPVSLSADVIEAAGKALRLMLELS
ncbi:MAG: quinolinate synthase NadA [Candidatus Wallbacteria bacterium]|nr:quinolinate synthase NadA [Candidatus Wallbacteria bacterium]